MASCFLSHDDMSPESVLQHTQGKLFVVGSHYDIFGNLKNGRGYHTSYTYDQGKRSKTDIGQRDSLAGLLSYMSRRGDSGQKILLGNAGLFHSSMNTIYVVGSKTSILKMFQDANDTPEIVISPTLYIGVCRWANVLTADRIGVRIKADGRRGAAPRQDSKKPHFWDTDVTEDLQCIVKSTSVHPLAFVLPLKNIFDSNKL